jgi:hypothetical protein
MIEVKRFLLGYIYSPEGVHCLPPAQTARYPPAWRARRMPHDYLSFTIEKTQNPPGCGHVSQDVREKGTSVMLRRFVSTAFVVGTLVTASIPAVGLAQNHGGRSGGGRSSTSRGSVGSNRGQSFAGGSHNYAPRGSSGGNRYAGGRSFASPRGYSGRPSYYGGGYVAPRSYGRPFYRGFYGGGVYLGYGAPYGNPYYPGYLYGPGYADPGYSYGSAPAPQVCADGSYDQSGAWVPGPNCYSNQRQYWPPQQNYNSNQRQYPPPPQNYDPSQQQYQQPQQSYDPSQEQYQQPQQSYDPSQQQYQQPQQNYGLNPPQRYNR